MAHNNEELMELDAIKEQFGYINEKLDKQPLINEKMISENIRTRINRTEQWYRQRFLIYALCPVGVVSFVNMGFHWGFIALFVAICIAQFLLDRKCYKTLNLKELAVLPVTKASENIAQHVYWRGIADKAMILPLILLAGWTVMIAAGYTMNLPIIAITAFMITLGFIWGFKKQKSNMKKLDEAMEAIRDLKG